MTKLSFGVFDVMSRAVAESYPSAADMYDDHIQLAAEVEQKGYEYYFSIEHQSSPLYQIAKHHRLDPARLFNVPKCVFCLPGKEYKRPPLRYDDLSDAISSSD